MGAGVIPFAVAEGKVSFLFQTTFSGRKVGHLIDFGGDESVNRPENTIPFYLDNYIALVDWTGRAR